MTREAAIAVFRFGMGAKPGEIAAVEKLGPEDWLIGQMRPDTDNAFQLAGLASSKEYLVSVLSPYGGTRYKDASDAERKVFLRKTRNILNAEVRVRLEVAKQSTAPFRERLTRFWSNHFSISARPGHLSAIAGAYEREAIRPSLFGTFEQMLVATTLHPAMLIYLDNIRSVGPHSSLGKRNQRGLNENLAREVMELRTVSTACNYSQSDVTEFSRALTGWTIGKNRDGVDLRGTTLFRDMAHEPGARQVLGTRYPPLGGEQALMILKDLARHPFTARHIARQLAAHFVADQPPQSLIDKLQTAFLENGGDLPTLYRTLIGAPESWSPALGKFKSPEELIVSASRMLSLNSVLPGGMVKVYTSFGQFPFSAPSPKGWPDGEGGWLSPDALNKRIEWAKQVAVRNRNMDPGDFVDDSLGGLASQNTMQAVAQAESKTQGLVIALMSPEFQMR